jgi:hypothetical protein
MVRFERQMRATVETILRFDQLSRFDGTFDYAVSSLPITVTSAPFPLLFRVD